MTTKLKQHRPHALRCLGAVGVIAALVAGLFAAGAVGGAQADDAPTPVTVTKPAPAWAGTAPVRYYLQHEWANMDAPAWMVMQGGAYDTQLAGYFTAKVDPSIIIDGTVTEAQVDAFIDWAALALTVSPIASQSGDFAMDRSRAQDALDTAVANSKDPSFNGWWAEWLTADSDVTAARSIGMSNGSLEAWRQEAYAGQFRDTFPSGQYAVMNTEDFVTVTPVTIPIEGGTRTDLGIEVPEVGSYTHMLLPSFAISEMFASPVPLAGGEIFTIDLPPVFDGFDFEGSTYLTKRDAAGEALSRSGLGTIASGPDATLTFTVDDDIVAGKTEVGFSSGGYALMDDGTQVQFHVDFVVVAPAVELEEPVVPQEPVTPEESEAPESDELKPPAPFRADTGLDYPAAEHADSTVSPEGTIFVSALIAIHILTFVAAVTVYILRRRWLSRQVAAGASQ